MELATFLSILGTSIGFVSAIFFAIGSISLSPSDIYSTVVARHTINHHLYESISKQRAEYVAGSVLLLLAFCAQMASSLVPKDTSPAFLQSPTCAWLMFGLVITALLLAAILFRHIAARACAKQVRTLWDQKVAATETRIANHNSQNNI